MVCTYLHELDVCVYMHLYVCICMCVFMYVCVYTYVYMSMREGDGVQLTCLYDIAKKQITWLEIVVSARI